MIHKHQFVQAGECEKPRPNSATIYSTIQGYIYVCIDPECDALRRVWSDGEKEIVREGLADREE